MNLPNQLTLSRLVMTVLFVGAVLSRAPFSDSVALGLFVAASVTDYLDGRIARRRNLITNFGILMDPLVDKILICSAFIAFVGRDLIPAWMAVIIVVRELAITGLRLLAAAKNVVLAAEGFGKHKTASQIAAIIGLLLQQSYPEWGSWAVVVFESWLPLITKGAIWLAVALTIYSGLMYLMRNREVYLNDM